MNKRAFSLTSSIAFCLALASCAAEPTHSPVTPIPSATVSAFPIHIHTHTPTPTLPPAPTLTFTQPPPTELPPTSITHTIQPGDTLLGLARQYGVPMAAIQLHNGMGDSTVVQVGEMLSIPPPAGWEGASSFWIVHVVEAGETLVGIAHTCGLKAAELEAVNGLTDADRIGIGQELVLPLDAPAVALAPTPTASATPPPSLTPIPPSPAVSPAPTVAPAAPPPADVAGLVDEAPREIARLINEARAQYGLPPLAYNETLAQVAQAHANDCLQRGWGSHYGSDGSNVKTRMQRAGYDPARWSECWAHTQSPQRAMDLWMDEASPNDPHRRTILSTWLTEIGVGVVEPDWGYYFFADFGRP